MTELTRERLCQLFNATVSCCIATPDMSEARLWPEEIISLGGALEKRRREFTAGRAAARQALQEFGAPSGPILMNTDRSPKWPPGIVGSISHCDNCCVAVVGRSRVAKSLGVDVESSEPLQKEIQHLICDRDEIARFNQDCSFGNCDWGKLAFCAKEAFYKCYYPITKVFLDFLDVSIYFAKLDENTIGEFFVYLKSSDRPSLPPDTNLTGRWLAADGVIVAGVTLV